MPKKKSEPTFSIIIPTRNRDGRYERGALQRCLLSVAHQTYPHDLYEIIIVDDGNTVEDQEFLGDLVEYMIPDHINRRVIAHDYPLERYKAYNSGMKEAKNDWIVFLDDDDEYVSFYLEFLADSIKKNPKYKLFNYGGLICNKKDSWMRARPVVEFEQKVGCECESGMIVNGQFAFHRSCLKHKEVWMPNTSNLWIAYDLAGIPGYGSKKGDKPLGNPWGQDFYIWYKLTRHYISKPLDYYLFICHIRGSE